MVKRSKDSKYVWPDDLGRHLIKEVKFTVDDVVWDRQVSCEHCKKMYPAPRNRIEEEMEEKWRMDAHKVTTADIDFNLCCNCNELAALRIAASASVV